MMPRKPSLDNLRNTLQRLSLEQKREIQAWLSETILRESAAQEEVEQEALLEISPQQERAASAQQHYQGKTYQQEKRRCNRAGCICMSGEVAEVGHGPYWYAYWKEQGKLRSQYVGKRPPWEK